MKSRYLLCLCFVLSHAWGAAKECNAPLKGTYKNQDHGYSFAVPAGLGGHWQSPCSYDESLDDCICMGSHGLFMPIGEHAALNVVSFYPTDPESQDIGKLLSEMLEEQRENLRAYRPEVLAVEEVVVARNHGKRITAQWVDVNSHILMKKYSYLLATRPFKTRWPRAELTVSLIAPDNQFEALLPRLEQVLNSLRWLSDTDVP